MAQALQEPVPVLPEAVAVRSEPEYRPCPHCGHQLEVQLYVRRFKVPSLPLGFLPSHNCRLPGVRSERGVLRPPGVSRLWR